MSALVWLPLAVNVASMCTAIAIGRIDIKRDFFFLLVYAQSLIYLDVAPTLVSPHVPFATAGRYAYFQWVAVALFQMPFLAVYIWCERNFKYKGDRAERLSTSRAALLFGACLALAIGYYVVGASHGLLDRRAEEMTARQLDLSLFEFAIFRSFTELGTFLIALQLLVLRRCDSMHRPRWMTTAFTLSSLAYLSYALVNSRMMSLIFLTMLYGVYLATGREPWRFRAKTLLAAFATITFAIYALRVATNVRQSVGVGESMFAASNFLPTAIDRGVEVTPVSSRLNGLDLIELISDNVERVGPAWGRAWAIPLVISLDPIVRTNSTVQAKGVGLTSTKSLLLLMYAGLPTADYFSCMLSDAYGNLGLFGFPAAAVLLACLIAWASRLLTETGKPLAVVFGLFVLARVLPFEQEFATVLFGWLKLFPLFLIAVFLYPLRPRPQTHDELAR